MKVKILFLLIIISLILNAEGGYQFLYIDNNPLTLSMGETGNIYSNNFLKNPVNSYFKDYFYIYAYHTEYFLNVNMEQLGFILSMPIGNFGFDIKGLYTDKMPKTYNGTIDSSAFFYYSTLTNVNYSKNIVNNFIVGLNTKILYSSVDTFNAFGFLFDFGAAYMFDFPYTIGLSINNIAFNLKYVNSSYQPIIIRMGNNIKINNINFMFDINYYISENNMFEINSGLEYSLFDILFLRVGYAFNNKYYNLMDNIRGGLGININGVNINYAVSYINVLGITHNIGISYNYGFFVKKKEITKQKLYTEIEKKLEEKEKMMADIFIKKVKEYMEQNDYENALENIDLALIWYPESQEASILSGIIEENMDKWKIDKMFEQGIDAYMNEDYINAMNIFNQIIKLDKNNKKAMDYYEKSLSEYNKTIINSKEKQELNKGVKYYENGKYIEAYKIFDKLSANNQIAQKYLKKTKEKIIQIVDTKIKYIDKLYKNGNYISAIKEAKTLLKYSVKTKEINSIIEKIKNNLNKKIKENINKGKELFKLKQYKEAEEYFRKVIVIDSTNSEARDYIEKIKNMNIYSMEDLESMYLKGIEAYTNNNFRLSIQYWQKCLEINPNYTKALKNIEKAKKKIKELENE